MALINCPECGEKISDKAAACIHCRFPLECKSNNVCKINGVDKDLSPVLKLVNLGETDAEIIQKEIQITILCSGLSLQDYYELAHLIIEERKVPASFDHMSRTAKPLCCPHCGSTSISTGARGVNHFWGFIGASKTVNRCAKCGHMWEPKG